MSRNLFGLRTGLALVPKLKPCCGEPLGAAGMGVWWLYTLGLAEVI